MIRTQVRKSGNSFFVTIPKDEVERLGLSEGDLVALHITPMEVRPVLCPALREALDAVWPGLVPDVEYLKDRLGVREYLAPADVIALYEETMRRMGWTPAPLRDAGALEAAIMRPRHAAYDEGADVIRQAALLAIGISRAQAFVDGNKRMAAVALRVFPFRAGFVVRPAPAALARQLEAMAEDADRQRATAAFEDWLRAHVAAAGG